MSDDAFLTFTVPAHHTKVGTLTERVQGCRVDLVGRPVIRDSGHAYRLHYLVEGVPADAKQAIEEEMAQVYETVETIAWDAQAGTWEVEGVVAVENIDSPGLRFVAGLFGLTDAPWVLFEGGKATVRLHARRPEAAPGLAERVHSRLASMGVDEAPQFVRMDMDLYRRRAAAVGLQVA